jgi:methyl-accepting chemotaxis protein
MNVVEIFINAHNNTDGAFNGLHNGMNRIQQGAGKAGAAISSFAQTAMSADDPKTAFVKLGAFLTAAPILAQAAGAAITLGLGGAIAGIGLKFAAENDEVKASFSELKEHVSGQLREMSKPFQETLKRMSVVARETFDSLAPALGSAMKVIAPQITAFGEQLGEAFKGVGPLIETTSAKFGPLIEVIGNRMPDVVNTLVGSLNRIMEAADPKALDMMIDAFNATVVVVAETIRFFETMGSTMATVWDTVKQVGSGIGEVFGFGSDESSKFAETLTGVSGSADNAADSVGGLTQKIMEMASQALAAAGSERAMEEAIDNASEAARKNGRTLDINTKKGRDNQASLYGIAEAALRMKADMDKAGTDSSRAMNRARGAFISTARSMGLSRSEASRLADQFGLVRSAANRIPGSKTTRVKAVGIGEAIRASKNMENAVRSVPTSWTTYFRTVNIGDAIRRSKEMAHGGIVGAAGGGPRSGLVMVGEQGRELVRVPTGSTVLPHGQTESMMAGGGGGGATRLEWGGGPTDELGRAVWKYMKENIRAVAGTGDGSVQQALGR